MLVLEFNIICVNAFASTPDSGIGADDHSDSLVIPVDSEVIVDAPGAPSSPPHHAPVQEEDDDDDDDDEPDGGGHCCRPFNDPLINAILLILNHFVLLLLQKIGCYFERVQLIGSEAKSLSESFEKDAVTTIVHPAAVQRSFKGQTDNLNPYQMKAVNAFIAEIIKTHPLYSGNDKQVFEAFKKALCDDQEIYKFLFANSFTDLESYTMPLKEALYRFRKQEWTSNMKRTTYDLDEAQRITSSTEYKQGRDFLFRTHKKVGKPKVRSISNITIISDHFQ